MKGISRRHFCQTSSLLMAGLSTLRATADPIRAVQYEAMEWSYTSRKAYPDPFNAVELDVIVTHSDGREQRVPAFWAGEQNWTVRFSPHRTGRYSYRTICSDSSNSDLHGRTGSFEAVPYSGAHPLYRHGPIKVAPDRRHFEHADGTPFFWLGDTWWMAFCQRLRWPEDLQTLTADRVRKGFSVIQIVAGLYPDMPQFDPRGANEAGYPWERDLSRVNPSYFDMADLRLRYLVSQGLVPCVVGGWGYYLPILGEKKIKQHWRYLVARWGAYPTIWCLAGEGTMPYYLSENKERDKALQKTGWTSIARYLRSTDPYGHPITIHPSDSARNTVDDPAVLDFDMLQTGHSDRNSIPNTVRLVTESLQQSPAMPVINGEVCYEGIAEASRQEVQRFMFWACVLSGAAGQRTEPMESGRSTRPKSLMVLRRMGALGVTRLGRKPTSSPGPASLDWPRLCWRDLPGGKWSLTLNGLSRTGVRRIISSRMPRGFLESSGLSSFPLVGILPRSITLRPESPIALSSSTALRGRRWKSEKFKPTAMEAGKYPPLLSFRIGWLSWKVRRMRQAFPTQKSSEACEVTIMLTQSTGLTLQQQAAYRDRGYRFPVRALRTKRDL